MSIYTIENVFVPLRSGPSHKSEMLSQLLFGEKFTISGAAGSWIKVLTLFDNYEGWVDGDHLHSIECSDDSRGTVLSRNLICFRPDGTRIILEPGCEVNSPDFKNKSFKVGGVSYTTQTEFSEGFVGVSGSMPETAQRFINAPYIWGGRVPSGIDCSGLAQLVYKIWGKRLPRDSWKQALEGTTISFLEESRPGDLVFFDNETGSINHVGMIYSEGLVIHASGMVRIDPLDQTGIYRKERKGYSHKLRIIKRHE